jgi:hypothetical protein
MLCLLNRYRVANGRRALVLDDRLARAARAHALDMVARDYFDHDTPEGDGPTERAERFGFPSGVGENIAYSSHVTPLSMFEMWRESPGHNQNMLYTSYTVVGIGFALGTPPGGPGSQGATGVQDFGRIAVPAGGETGLDDPVPPAQGDGQPQGGPCPSTAPATAPLAAAVEARRRWVRRALARYRADVRRLAATRGRRARARARARMRASRRNLLRARASLRAGQARLSAARTRAQQACNT